MSPRLSENPWFWLMLFGSLGAVGVVVIGPKYGPRMGRMERMAETRERVNAAKELGVSATEVRKLKPGEAGGRQTGSPSSPAGSLAAGSVAAAGAPSGSAGRSGSTASGSAPSGSASTAGTSSDKQGPIEPYVESDYRRPPQLTWLLGLMVALMLAGTAGMIHSRRKQTA